MIAQNTNTFFEKTDTFLKASVSNGSVNYKAIYDNSESLDEILQLAKKVVVTKENKEVYQAFWINAYNIAVIKGIIDNYPIQSPLDKNGFFDKTTYELGGKKITLNDIENKMLRMNFEDARVHFVLVCGAKGCPPLIPEAYTPEKLEQQVNKQTIKALNNDLFIQVSKKKVALSEIFKWYREDFISMDQNEIDFINIYREQKINPKLKITYYPYNWNLNSN
jgi:hypothetical protein